MLLERLELNNNKLNILCHLESLLLNDNLLTTFPETMDELYGLKYLSLNSNQLTGIPEFVLNLVSLKRLEMKNNPLTDLVSYGGKMSKLELNNILSEHINNYKHKIGKCVIIL